MRMMTGSEAVRPAKMRKVLRKPTACKIAPCKGRIRWDAADPVKAGLAGRGGRLRGRGWGDVRVEGDTCFRKIPHHS